MSAAPGDCTADEERLARGGRALLHAVRLGVECLQDAQQIEDEQDRQKRCLRREELAQAEVVGREILLQFGETRFDCGALVVVTPQPLGCFTAVGDEDAKLVAGDGKQPLFLRIGQPQAHRDETPRSRRTPHRRALPRSSTSPARFAAPR